MICRIVTRGIGVYYTKGNLNDVITNIKQEIPITCFWYTDCGKRYQEDIIFPDSDEVRLVCTESDIGVLEDI